MPIRQVWAIIPSSLPAALSVQSLVWHADQMGVSPCCRPTFPVPQRGTACYNMRTAKWLRGRRSACQGYAQSAAISRELNSSCMRLLQVGNR